MVLDSHGDPTTHLPTIHQIFREEWSKVYNTHKDTKPDFKKFSDAYGKFFPDTPAPQGPPNGEQLFNQAKRAKYDSAPGMDGWKPGELKILPQEAWNLRAQHLHLAYKVRSSPNAYYHIPSPALPKVDKLEPEKRQTKHPTAMDHRLLSLMSAMYRV